LVVGELGERPLARAPAATELALYLAPLLLLAAVVEGLELFKKQDQMAALVAVELDLSLVLQPRGAQEIPRPLLHRKEIMAELAIELALMGLTLVVVAVALLLLAKTLSLARTYLEMAETARHRLFLDHP
jgi:hypothetical protein